MPTTARVASSRTTAARRTPAKPAKKPAAKPAAKKPATTRTAKPKPAKINERAKKLPSVTDLTSSNKIGVADIEALVAEQTDKGMRVLLRFRSMNANEYPSEITLKMTQTPLGTQVLKTFTEMIKPVSSKSTVSEGEILVNYSDFKAQGLKPGQAMGIYARWTKFSGHDRDFSENPIYQFKAP